MKERRINQVRAGAVLSYINMAIGSLIPMFYTPIMLQLLGQDEYGLFKLSSSVTSYLSLVSFGIGSAMVRYFTKYRAEKDKEGEENVFGLFCIIFRIISGIAVAAGIVIVFLLDSIYGNSLTQPGQLDKLRILVLILTVSTAFGFLCSPYNSIVTSHERFLFLQIINILSTIVVPIANLIVLFMGFKSIGMALSSFALAVVVQIVYFFYVRNNINLKPRYDRLPRFLLKEILVFSFWIFVANIVSQLYNSTDTIIIGAIPALATIGVAVYNVGLTFNSMMTTFSLGILSVLSPKVNMLVFSNSTNAELTELMIRIGRIQCYIVSLVCFGFISFGRQFIFLWAGQDYSDAYFVALVTMIPSSVPLLQNVALNVIVAQNKHRFRSITYLLIAVINVVGTLLCVNQFGIVGAAIVTGAATILGQGFIMNWYYWKKINLDIPRFWKSMSIIFVAPALMCIITLVLSSFISFYSWIPFLIGVIIFTVVFIAFNWLFVMNDYEKDIFRGPVRKISAKFKRREA